MRLTLRRLHLGQACCRALAGSPRASPDRDARAAILPITIYKPAARQAKSLPVHGGACMTKIIREQFSQLLRKLPRKEKKNPGGFVRALSLHSASRFAFSRNSAASRCGTRPSLARQ